MVKITHVLDTPNPDAVKFMLEGRILASGARSFENPQAGANDPLASAIFAVGPVASVFYMDRFVTVTKYPGADWNEIQAGIVKAIEANAKPAEEPPQAAAGTAGPDNDVLDSINRVLDENIRPALAGDGGGLEVLAYKDFVLSVHYQGACGSCPSSTSGTLFAIQNLLQRMVDERIQVVSV